MSRVPNTLAAFLEATRPTPTSAEAEVPVTVWCEICGTVETMYMPVGAASAIRHAGEDKPGACDMNNARQFPDVHRTPPGAAPACPTHGAPMQLRQGRTGAFYGCTRYPDCRETAPVGLPGIFCPTCQSPIVERVAKKSGRPFWPCGNRSCDFVASERPHLCGHGQACFGAERPRLEPDTVPDPAIPRGDDDLPF